MSDAKPARPARPVTRDFLFRAAAHYLERYATSAENLRRVLRRKVSRRARERGEDPQSFEPLIEETLARLRELKLLDDAAFAEARLASLRRRGTSLRHAEAKLRAKGVAADIVAGALERDQTSEQAAAEAYAKRRRLGPYRTSGREERRDRDVQAMMRAGFSYSQAKEAVDASRDDDAADGRGRDDSSIER